jgi:hypothetical protein
MYKYPWWALLSGLGENAVKLNQHNANTGHLPFEFLISKVGFLYTMKCCC